MRDIPQYGDFLRVTPLNKGWSTDKKYIVEMKSGEKLLLRMADISELARKQSEFEAVCTVSKQGISMSQPVGFGICNGGKSVYTLLTWVDGEDTEETLKELSVEEQYSLGVMAGRILRKIHSIPAPETQEAWETRFNRKIDRKIAGYKKCGLRINGDDAMLAYIECNRHLLKDRPQTFQHGDYHIGNMISSHAGGLSIIDFNRFDYGDPWEEFNRIVWCASFSSHFASGRINGYFNDDVPQAFFDLLALYISSNTLSSIYWAIPFGQTEVDTMVAHARWVLEFYNGMTSTTPKWYVSS